MRPNTEYTNLTPEPIICAASIQGQRLGRIGSAAHCLYFPAAVRRDKRTGASFVFADPKIRKRKTSAPVPRFAQSPVSARRCFGECIAPKPGPASQNAPPAPLSDNNLPARPHPESGTRLSRHVVFRAPSLSATSTARYGPPIRNVRKDHPVGPLRPVVTSPSTTLTASFPNRLRNRGTAARPITGNDPSANIGRPENIRHEEMHAPASLPYGIRRTCGNRIHPGHSAILSPAPFTHIRIRMPASRCRKSASANTVL